MTRLARFTPLSSTRSLVIAGVAAAGISHAPAAGAAEIPFAPAAVISSLGTRPSAVAPADVDRDGDLDLLAVWAEGNRVAWLDNANGDGSVWTLRTIATDSTAMLAVVGADVDGDGAIDAVVTSRSSNEVFWYDNTAGDGTAWIRRTISAAVTLPLAIAAGDVDGDGDVDVVSASSIANNDTLYFHENAAGDGTVWTLRTVHAGEDLPLSLALADMDRDGDLDVLVASANDQTLAWHENLAGNGSLWLMRTVTTSANGAQDAAAADVDRDGDLDIVAAQVGLAWYENVAGNGQGWTTHTIGTSAGLQGAIEAGDVDGDGDVDAVSVDFSNAVVRWHDNVSGDGGTWVTRTTGTTSIAPSDAILADLDGDGDQDVVWVAEFTDQISWHRNLSIHQTACFGPARTIFATDFPFGSTALDADRDGDLDVFSTSMATGAVSWHRNDGEGAAWTSSTLVSGHSTFTVNAADVDGDGDPDALLGASPSNPAAWIENVINGTAWFLQSVSTPGGAVAFELEAADLDGDGDVDALGAAVAPGPLAWFENQNGQGDTWLAHTVATVAQNTGARPVDLDRDGDEDILATEFGTPLVWHENASGNGSSWTQHTISATTAFAAVALDLDFDGDLDVIAANATTNPGVLWHENLSGDGTTWAAHTLSTQPDLSSLEPRDVDADGDLDLVVAQGANVAWMERTGPGVGFVLRTVATMNVPGTIGSPDLDGDGRPDVLWTAQSGDAVLWNRNGRGQVVLDLADQVPSGVNNNDVFPIFRLTVTHGGRTGDSDLELASLGLRFEEGAGDPLTSVEANALVEELRVYRDANGNGVFEPGTDTLVATVPTLALTAGVQTVAFTDGDPNLQVALGTPRTFFVVAQLTATASQQAPNQFLVTHLATGASATRTEDRTADIPLTLACPADFASRVIGPVVPVELTGFTIE